MFLLWQGEHIRHHLLGGQPEPRQLVQQCLETLAGHHRQGKAVAGTRSQDDMLHLQITGHLVLNGEGRCRPCLAPAARGQIGSRQQQVTAVQQQPDVVPTALR